MDLLLKGFWPSPISMPLVSREGGFIIFRLTHEPSNFRPTPNSAATVDEPLSWDAREYLRKMVVGKNVLGGFMSISRVSSLDFLIQMSGHVVHTANREYGVLLLWDNPETAVDVAVKLVEEGLAKVRSTCHSITEEMFNHIGVKVRDNCQDSVLISAQEGAKNKGVGMWAEDSSSKVCLHTCLCLTLNGLGSLDYLGGRKPT